MPSKPVSLLIIGAGSRGAGYATYAEANPQLAQVIGVAEPRAAYRELLQQRHRIPAADAVTDWRQLADRPRCADAVVIATQDRDHLDPAIAFARKGYHLLLEKPMAPNPEDCRRIVEAVVASGVILSVCHVLRYTRYTEVLKELLDAGTIGDLVNIQHLEPVGFWHQAHSFVRGNWRREDESAPMLLAKCCHDIDWLRYMVGAPCRAVSSFGSLRHFRKEARPKGAAARCLDCRVEPTCPYSAKRLYLGKFRRGERDWPLAVLTPHVTRANLLKALRTGPYGRCVYTCDNDVVDQQVVNLEYTNGTTASLTMVAFSEMTHRRTRLFGTRGEIEGDGQNLTIYDFLTERKRTIDTQTGGSSLLNGHGGGDLGLMRTFIEAVAKNDPSLIRSGPAETLETHLTVFEAERARREGKVIQIAPHTRTTKTAPRSSATRRRT